MIPLKTQQGMSASELLSTINNRDVYIWGSGPLGQGVLVSLRKYGVIPAGFIDGRQSEVGKTAYGMTVFSVDETVKNPDAFIVIANIEVRSTAEAVCRRHGRTNPESYLTYLQISRPEAAIDVAGMCSIRCPSCPRGNMNSLLPEGCMSFETYIKVLDKLMSDVPHLINVDLSTWGEPLCNPAIASIIGYTEKRVPCTVSTNLLQTDMIEQVVTANPTRLNITVNGYEQTYEKNMKGASWDCLLNNMLLLKKCLDKRRGETLVRILAFSFEGNAAAAEKMTALARKLDLQLTFATAYLNPYENYAAYCGSGDISAMAREEIARSAWDVDDFLRRAAEDRNGPCLCQRIFPIINWDTSVALCHTYYGPVIAESYLDISWLDLLAVRHRAPQCIACQDKGLHRLDIDVLQRKTAKVRGAQSLTYSSAVSQEKKNE